MIQDDISKYFLEESQTPQPKRQIGRNSINVSSAFGGKKRVKVKSL